MAGSRKKAGVDPFTRAYLEGMPESLEGTARALRRGGPKTLAHETIALGGQVITAQGARKGWVRIENGVIASISSRKPAGAVAIQTDGVILPGMLDLHGHPEFNVFAPWEPPKS